MSGERLSPETSDLVTALELLDLLRDPDPCWFDHDGGCQAHGFLSLEPGEVCPNEEARRLVLRHSPGQADPS